MSNLSQPSLKGARVPPGHVLVHAKFQGSQILQFIQGYKAKSRISKSMDQLSTVDYLHNFLFICHQ